MVIFLNDARPWTGFAQVAGRPTPTPAAGNTNSRPIGNGAIANATNVTVTVTPANSNKQIPKTFTLGKDSQSEHGEVPFDHDTHAFKTYSPDGKSVIGCVECHHTDQPKSALKPPLVTSEREVALTLDTWRASTQKVQGCRACHYQSGSVPDNATMPTATYSERGKQVTKDLNNELAYHINCNTCHDAAAKLRPELKSRSGFATSTDCMTCHRPN
jgi:Zn ribbon nucleic-acid-binding protein